MTRLIVEVMRLVITTYPVRWSAKEAAVALGAPVRSVTRSLSALAAAGLLSKSYSAYSLSPEVVEQFYGAKWYFKQELQKSLRLANAQEKIKEAKNGSK